MKKIIYLTMLGIFLAIPSVVKAAPTYYECEVTNMTKLQKLASNITSTYDYEEIFNENSKYGDVTFTVMLSNLNENLYIVERESEQRYNYTSNEMIFRNIKPGRSIAYDVYGNGLGCVGERILTLYVNVPPYNKYYTDEICEGIEDSKLCSRWYKMDVTYNEFKSKVEKYKASIVIKPEETDNKKSFEEIFIEVVAFLDRYKMVIFMPIVIISAILIVFLKYLNKKDEFDLK